MSRFALAVALAVLTPSCVVEPLRPPAEISGIDTCALPRSFQDSWADLQMTPGDQALPGHVRERLNEYLLNRVGQQVAQTLRVREVWFLRDSHFEAGTRHSDEPADVAYAVFVGLPVVDDMSSCGNFVDREYCAGVWLNTSGDPLTVIGLPSTVHDPSKKHLLTRAEAEAVLSDADLEVLTSTLNYDPDLDILLWRIEASRHLASGERGYIDYSVNAHTGTILGWRDMSVLY